MIDCLGFILYIIGYVFLVLFSTPDHFELRKELCNCTNSSRGAKPFFSEPCIPQILSTFVVT